MTSCVTGKRSNQLNYQTIIDITEILNVFIIPLQTKRVKKHKSNNNKSLKHEIEITNQHLTHKTSRKKHPLPK